MMKYLTTFGLCLFTVTAICQKAQTLYENLNYQEILSLTEKDSLTTEELFFIGRAFFKVENDEKAVEYYDKAIQKGLNTSDVYFFKGLSLRYLGKRQEAIEQYDLALSINPKSQKCLSEKALAFYYANILDSAYQCCMKAMQLPYEVGIPYYIAPHILHKKKDEIGALKGFYEAVQKIDPQDEYYIQALMDIGRLEYTVTKNYKASARAYEEVIKLDPSNYDLYPKLIKAYYGDKNYTEGDSLISIMKKAYENEELSSEYMEYGSVAIDEFQWKDQHISTYKYFNDPENSLDLIYKLYLLTPDKKTVERTFQTEQTIKLPNGYKHILCEKVKGGTHHTYPYGWKTDTIDYDDLKKAVVLVLDEKMKPQATSSFGKGKRRRNK